MTWLGSRQTRQYEALYNYDFLDDDGYGGVGGGDTHPYDSCNIIGPFSGHEKRLLATLEPNHRLTCLLMYPQSERVSHVRDFDLCDSDRG